MNKKRMIVKITTGFTLLLWVILTPNRHIEAISQAPKQNGQLASTTISVIYVGDWNPEAQAAMEYAVTIWEGAIYSPVPIEIEAYWGSDFLGGPAYTSPVYTQDPSLPNPYALYPSALAMAIQGRASSGSPDFVIRFNSDFDNWYFGTDGRTPGGDYDFVTVALKYIGWGLGLESWMRLCGPGLTDGCYGDPPNYYPLIYDTFAVDSSGQHLTDRNLFPNPSPALKRALTSDDVYFAGPKAVAANGGAMPKLYAPGNWLTTMKYPLLLDDRAFPRGSINALMTHTLETGETIHHPGPVALAMLSDLGWPDPPQAPILMPLPSQLLLVNTSRVRAFDLRAYAYDPDTPTAELIFRFVDIPAAEAGVTLDDGRFVTIRPEAGWTGRVQVSIEVEDPTGLTGRQSFDVIVVEQIYQDFLPVVYKP